MPSCGPWSVTRILCCIDLYTRPQTPFTQLRRSRIMGAHYKFQDDDGMRRRSWFLSPYFSRQKLRREAKMRAGALILFVLCACLRTTWSFATPRGRGLAQRTLLSDNLTTQIEWDNYSLVVDGQRIFLYSGEFHTYRLPVPSLWLDILQKVKAAGLNAVSVYTHWGSINPSPGVVDFDSYRALEPLYEAALAAGVFIVLRPGPYINAETTAGGIAHWVTSQVAGTLRTNASDYYASWQDYISGIIEQTKPYQFTNGGPVIAIQIDNEYTQTPETGEYYAQLEAAYRKGGIVIPLTYNDPNEGRNFINGTGAVDIYGFDSYPQGFDCSNPENWAGVVTNYHSYHMSADPYEPLYFPEFQGGSFDAWGPGSPGYDKCRILTGPEFESVFNLQLWASNAKLISYYMIYGGTSWGGIPFGGVYTSYDYGSSIQENRALTTKHEELKRQGVFLRSSPEFYKTDWVTDSGTSGSAPVTTNSAIYITYLRNPDTGAGFYVARQKDSTSTAIESFKLNVSTSLGGLQIPQVASNITLGGRQSKVLVTDYKFGSSRALYSTAPVFFAGSIGGRDILYIFGDTNQEHELALELKGSSKVKPTSSVTKGNLTIITFNGTTGLNTVWDSSEQLILFSDTVTAGGFSNPVVPPSTSTANFAHYWQFGSNETVLVGGPYLVRNATISGSTLALRGDLNASTTLSIIAPTSVKKVTWNGKPVSKNSGASTKLSNHGGFVGSVGYSAEVHVPALSTWKYADSLPEVASGFDDSSWVLANHTTTNIPYPMYYGDGRVLYGCDYGFCENIVLWRGHFNATGSETSVNLTVNGGEAFAATVWLNDQFLTTIYGNSTNDANSIEEAGAEISFPSGSIKVGQDNVITIVQDNMGLDETEDLKPDTSKSPRGVRGFQLKPSGSFGEWRVQGKLGGYTNFTDRTRGVMNNGGLYGERVGWYLPGFDTSSWETRNISSGLPNSTAGVGFFVTEVNLDIPSDIDALLSLTFANTAFNNDVGANRWRAYVFVNGWMLGKFVANLGPQYKFPVHEGIWDYSGTNTIAVAVWAMDAAAISPQLSLTVDDVYAGGVGGITTDNPGYAQVFEKQ